MIETPLTSMKSPLPRVFCISQSWSRFPLLLPLAMSASLSGSLWAPQPRLQVTTASTTLLHTNTSHSSITLTQIKTSWLNNMLEGAARDNKIRRKKNSVPCH